MDSGGGAELKIREEGRRREGGNGNGSSVEREAQGMEKEGREAEKKEVLPVWSIFTKSAGHFAFTTELSLVICRPSADLQITADQVRKATRPQSTQLCILCGTHQMSPFAFLVSVSDVTDVCRGCDPYDVTHSR